MESSTTRSRQQKEKVDYFQQLSNEEKIELRSFLASFTFHTFLLLFLALMHEASGEKKHIVVSLSFGSAESIIEPSLESQFIDLAGIADEQIDSDQQLSQSEFITETFVDSSIQIESINIENTDERKPIVEKISLEDLVSTVKCITPEQDIVSHKPVINTESRSSNVLEELIKTTTVGLLSQNQTPNAFGRQMGGMRGTGFGISERLKSAGAQTGDVQISIAWDTVDDIDLHVVVNMGGNLDHINWTKRMGVAGGMLDVDMNANNPPLMPHPVENVFWPKGSCPRGTFMVGVHFFRSWTGNTQVPVLIRIKNGNNIETLNVTAVLGKNVQEATRFNY